MKLDIFLLADSNKEDGRKQAAFSVFSAFYFNKFQNTVLMQFDAYNFWRRYVNALMCLKWFVNFHVEYFLMNVVVRSGKTVEV